MSITKNLLLNFKLKSLRSETATVISDAKSNWSKQFQLCTEATVVDRPGKPYRFTIHYYLLSILFNTRMCVITKTNELLPIISLANIYNSLNWSEREIWDMFGIFFIGHHDLRRILTDYGFINHPLRKDFPLTGFYELNYNETVKSISYSTVELTQEYRTFRFINPWNTKNYSDNS